MEQLNHLIKDASNEFECHNFQTSLSLYVRCIEKCREEKFPRSVLHNLKSSEAALRTILGEHEAALAILNQVLEEDKQHWLCLIRRSQIYKKQAKYRKALKDLDVLSMYAPDNMQVAALKLELKGLLAKPNGGSSSESESESQIQKIDEEEVLKFSNLKKIDRTSVSIMLPRGRQSRVTISGDKSYFYEAPEEKQPVRESIRYTPSFNCQRFIEIDKQLEETNESEDVEVPVVVVKAKPTRTKSILRNRDSTIYKADKLGQEAHQQQKKLIEKVQNIDGHIISAENLSVKEGSNTKGGLRKSLFADEPLVTVIQEVNQPQAKPKAKSGGRKSCLKRSSFSSVIEEVEKKGPRRSRFDSMSRSSIDGKFIKSEKKKDEDQVEPIKESKQTKEKRNSLESNGSENESEEGSHYNIFGSNKVVLNEELRENLGLGSDSIVESSEKVPKPKKADRNHSILKKTSILVKKQGSKKKASIFFREHEQQQEPEQKKPERKNKKSVMFISC